MVIALVTAAAFVLVVLLAAIVILTPFYLVAEWRERRSPTFPLFTEHHQEQRLRDAA